MSSSSSSYSGGGSSVSPIHQGLLNLNRITELREKYHVHNESYFDAVSACRKYLATPNAEDKLGYMDTNLGGRPQLLDALSAASLCI